MHEVTDTIPCRECPLQDCPGLRQLDERQLSYMEEFKNGEVRLDKTEVLIEQETETTRLYTVLEGVLMRYRTLEDGRRQILNFMFPGDLAGLQGAFEEPASHTIETLLESRLCVFKRSDFSQLIGQHPRLGYDLVWLAAKEERALEEHIVALGQRSARERLTYLAVWLLDRALATGISSSDNVLHLSITQNQIADMLGLSLVHTNRTVRQLEREGLVIWKNREITVPDMDKACEFAQFERRPGKIRPFI
ncbi:MAG: Crp/Fnr family transcriptional regulator [Erythrobacter sp.]